MSSSKKTINDEVEVTLTDYGKEHYVKCLSYCIENNRLPNSEFLPILDFILNEIENIRNNENRVFRFSLRDLMQIFGNDKYLSLRYLSFIGKPEEPLFMNNEIRFIDNE